MSDLAVVPAFESEEDHREEDPVLLGFFEPQLAPDALLRHRFPSKAGGQPAWLNPRDIPSTADTSCGNCSKPLKFILQVYAPLPDEKCYFRMLYLFCCENGDCLHRDGAMKVFRSQLPRDNEFYPDSSVKANENEEERHDQDGDFSNSWLVDAEFGKTKLCVLCGARGAKTCSRCKLVSYCSKEHQKQHWLHSHSKQCSVESKLDRTNEEVLNPIRQLLFPQYEIVIEEEDSALVSDIRRQDFSEETELLRKYSKGVKKLNQTEMKELSEMDFENNDDLDDQLAEFQKRIRPYPDQCIRYCRGLFSPILWMGRDNQIDPNSLPRCRHCEGKMVFEFQVLPQVLHFLNVDGWEGYRHCSMDWGTLTIFTCQNSCGDGTKKYFCEFVHLQRSPGAMQEFK